MEEMKENNKTPRVFISYSWESHDHKKWVVGLRGDNHLAVKNKLHEYFHVKFSLWEDIQYWLSYGGTYQSVLPVLQM